MAATCTPLPMQTLLLLLLLLLLIGCAAAQQDSCPGSPGRAGSAECPVQTCSSDDDCMPQARCVCDSQLCGSVCVQPDFSCKYLPELHNGRKRRRFRDWNENAAGQTVSFICNRGYTLRGPARISCQANGRWNAEDTLPVCVPADSERCGPPRQIPHTTIRPYPSEQQYSAGDEFWYSCSPGYRADSPGLNVSAICTKGVWSMRDIVCSVTSCGHPGRLRNGRHRGKNYTYNHKVSFFCNEGFSLHCSRPELRSGCQVRTCGSDGKWSGSAPMCKPITCPALRSPQNGKIARGWNTVNSVVHYSCNDGYRLIGRTSRMCRLSGRWDGEEPRCDIQDCGPPPPVPNAYKPVYRGTNYESKASYTCMPDTKFEGENGGEIICQKSGQWYPPPPRCRSHCRVPVVHLGKALVGKYNGPQATGKVASDTTLWIRCHANYRLETVFYPRCDNGTWTKIPKCVPKDCEDRPPLINKGIARFYGTNHGDRVDYKCYVGYEVTRGSSSLLCKFGKWVGQAPKCSRKQCPWIQSGPGIQKWLIGVKGAKNPWTRPETRANHEEIVSFKCRAKGFILRGHTHAICINGRWRPGGSPQCVRQMHKQIPDDWLFYRAG